MCVCYACTCLISELIWLKLRNRISKSLCALNYNDVKIDDCSMLKRIWNTKFYYFFFVVFDCFQDHLTANESFQIRLEMERWRWLKMKIGWGNYLSSINCLNTQLELFGSFPFQIFIKLHRAEERAHSQHNQFEIQHRYSSLLILAVWWHWKSVEHTTKSKWLAKQCYGYEKE